MFFKIYNFYRPSVLSIAAAFAPVVSIDSLRKVVGDTGVVGAVPALDYVDVPAMIGHVVIITDRRMKMGKKLNSLDL